MSAADAGSQLSPRNSGRPLNSLLVILPVPGGRPFRVFNEQFFFSLLSSSRAIGVNGILPSAGSTTREACRDICDVRSAMPVVIVSPLSGFASTLSAYSCSFRVPRVPSWRARSRGTNRIPVVVQTPCRSGWPHACPRRGPFRSLIRRGSDGTFAADGCSRGAMTTSINATPARPISLTFTCTSAIRHQLRGGLPISWMPPPLHASLASGV